MPCVELLTPLQVLPSAPPLAAPPAPHFSISPQCLSMGLYLPPNNGFNASLHSSKHSKGAPLGRAVGMRHTEAHMAICSAPGLCSPPDKGEQAADAEHIRSSTAEPLAAFC